MRENVYIKDTDLTTKLLFFKDEDIIKDGISTFCKKKKNICNQPDTLSFPLDF